MNKLGAVFLMLLAGATQAADRLQTVQVSGLSIPGTPAIGKELGFTECADKYDSYECKRSRPTVIYGAKANAASVSLNGKDNFSPLIDSFNGPKVSDVEPDKLTYRSIRLDFHLTEREILERALLADGWLKSGTATSYEYFKDGVAATFSFRRSGTSLSPMDIAEVNKQISVLRAKAAEAAKASASSSSFIETMKK